MEIVKTYEEEPRPDEADDRPKDTAASDQSISHEQWVKDEVAHYKRAKAKWDDDFTRMRKNMEFVFGLQHDSQSKIPDQEDRYTANWMLRAVKNKEAQLYARNPQVEVKQRRGLDFEIWDGSVEMLQEAMVGVQVSNQIGMPNIEAYAVMQDFMSGRAFQELVKRVCKTIEHVYQYETDVACPDFLAQMKKLVCRVITCGVGYIVPQVITPEEQPPAPSTVEVKHDINDRVKRAQFILKKMEEKKLDETSPEVMELHALFRSLEVSQQTGDYQLEERVDFDFPPPDSLFPDENCRDLQDFVGSKRVFQEFKMLIDDVNKHFDLQDEREVKVSGGVVVKNPDVDRKDLVDDPKSAPPKQGTCMVIRVFNIETKTDYYLVEGHKYAVRDPMPMEPCVKGFWPIVTLTFNNIETHPDTKTSPFPPSDVDLMKDAQKEWNRTRDALRAQRNANAPTMVVRKNVLSADDKDALRNREPNEVIELENVPTDKEPKDVIQILQVAAIDPAVYETNPQEQDMQLCGGVQQADIGPAQPDVTATVGTIAEQARISNISSNAQDLDWALSKLASMVVQMMLQTFSEQTVKRIARRGAVWPTDPQIRMDFLNQIDVTIKAASSGRPNQALKTSIRERIIPLLMQIGANPVACIEELVSTMDEDLDVQKFFPVPGQALQTAPQVAPQQGQGPAPRKPGSPSPQGPRGRGPAGPPRPGPQPAMPMMGGQPPNPQNQ
jgi:hypothetical protein